jgi:hypothetical protein
MLDHMTHARTAVRRTLSITPGIGVALGFGAILCVNSPAHAQTPLPSPNSRPSVGSTSGLTPPAQLPIISGSQDAAAKVHLDPLGKPCLSVRGYAKSQASNPNIYNHVIFASNNCAQSIKLNVCYYHTQHCVAVAVSGYARKESVLGIMPQMKEFRFEYREQFNNFESGVAGYRVR